MAVRIINTSISKSLFQKQQYVFCILSCRKHSYVSKQLRTRQQLKHKHHNYHINGPIASKSTRLAIAISPSVDDIWEHIQNCNKIDDSVFSCAMKRCTQLNSADDLSSIMDFLLDEECMVLSKMKGPNIHHWNLLFQGLYKLNELQSALEWLNIMVLQERKPSIMIFNYLIALCCKNNDIERAIKLFEWINKLELECDEYTFSEMIRLYSFNNDIEKAQQMMAEAKESNLLCTMHYNYFLKGLSLQQIQDDDNKLKEGLERMLCFEFESELIEYLPMIMHDLYSNMINKERLTPDIKTYEYLLSILSFYGNSSLCLYYFKEITNVFNLRPTINIFNSLISCYCNEISLFSYKNENDAMYYEKHLDLMDSNIDKTLAVYDNCKALLIAPNIDTLKLLFHCMNARIMLSQNKIGNCDEYTEEYNINLLKMLCDDDIENYKIHIDQELGYYIVHCWSMLDVETALKFYDKLYKNRIISHWNNDNHLTLLNIPQRIYEDCWQFYLQYIIESEMDKLINLDELVIVVPSFEGQRGVDVVQNEIQELLDIKLSKNDIMEDKICFTLSDCKSTFLD